MLEDSNADFFRYAKGKSFGTSTTSVRYSGPINCEGHNMSTFFIRYNNHDSKVAQNSSQNHGSGNEVSKPTQTNLSILPSRQTETLLVFTNGKAIPISSGAKYLGIHHDRGLTWRTNISSKRKQLRLQDFKQCWLTEAKFVKQKYR